MPENRIVATDLSKWYGEIRGVSGVNLSLGEGIIGLVGPNSAGKTTLLGLVSGLLKPSQGHIAILGETAFTRNKFRRQLGMAPQREAIYPHITVFDFVFQLTQLHGFSKAEAARLTGEALEKVGLLQEAHKKAHTLSKGTKQRLKLAQAIAHDPTILLLDETLSGCDPLVKHHLKILLDDLARSGKTILLSSHNLKEIELMTDQVVIIDRGRIVAQGKISELRDCVPNLPDKIQLEGKALRPLAIQLLAQEEIIGVRLDRADTSLLVETYRPNLFFQRLPRVVDEGGHWVEKVTSLEQDLQTLFQHLVKSRE